MVQEEAVTRAARGRFFAYAPLVIWAGVVLFLSTDNGSMAETSRFIRPLIEFFFPNAAPDTFLLVHAAIRKLAHFTEYGVLGLLASRAFSTSRVYFISKHWPILSATLVISIAVIDETNQSFEPSRTSSFRDVLLDAAGGIVLIAVFYAVRRFREKPSDGKTVSV